MIYLFQAVRALYNHASNIIGNDINDVEAFDVDGNSITLDKSAITTKNEELTQQAILNTCKKTASALLYATDWTTLSDVANTTNNPYLLNQAEFITYRNTVRQFVVNPVAHPEFPTTPSAQWSS